MRSKKPSLTMCRRAEGCWPIGGLGWPTTAKRAGPAPVKGGVSAMAAPLTPGISRARSRSLA